MSITQAQVAIITVTFNSSEFIEDYLASIIPFISNTQHKLIIIDNASTDNTPEIISRYCESQQANDNIHMRVLKKNIGFGKGCNAGTDVAKNYKPTHLWFLNPDTRVFNNSGQELLSLITKNNDVDFAGSVLVNDKMVPRAGAFRFPSLMNVLLSTMKLGVLDKLFHRYTTAIPINSNPYKADWLTGASFMVKTECIDHLQGFDPYYFLYFEEVDLFYRAKEAGFSVWACPNSQVFHISGASTGINNHQKAIKRQPGYWFESRRHFYISNYGHAYFAAVDLTFILCHLVWKLRSFIQKKEDQTPPHFIKDMLAHGYPRLLFKQSLYKKI